MKAMISSPRLFLIVLVCCAFTTLQAQPYAHAGEYMDAISAQYNDLMKDQWAYVKAVSRGRAARKIDKKRNQLLSTNRELQRNIRRMAAYEGDASLRDTVVTFLQLCYKVLNEDYGEIVDLEAIAEDSYDLMEAYLAAKKAANDKLDEAGERLDAQEKVFAARHNINLIEGEQSKLGQRIEQAGKVYDYYNRIYLIFFKSYKQELYLMQAIEEGNLTSLLQNQETLKKYAEEGMATLDTMPDFEGDRSLRVACRRALLFYQQEAEKEVPVFADFFLKQEAMQQVQQAFEAKAERDRTQEDVDQYNQAAQDYNEAVAAYNATNERLNELRSERIKAYNKAGEKFTDTHVR